MSFPVGEIICDYGCRSGLTIDFSSVCGHINQKRLSELAFDFIKFESAQKEKSELCTNLDIWVDDPEFWAQCCQFDQKLQRHCPKWIRNIFVEKAKSQMTRLVSRKMKKTARALFEKRAEQLELIADSIDLEVVKEEIRFLIEKQLQFYHL